MVWQPCSLLLHILVSPGQGGALWQRRSLTGGKHVLGAAAVQGSMKSVSISACAVVTSAVFVIL